MTIAMIHKMIHSEQTVLAGFIGVDDVVVVVAAVLVVEIVVRPLLLAFCTFPEYRTSNKITFNHLRFLLKSYLTSGVLQETNFQTKSCISQVSQTDFMRFLF